MTQCNEQTFGFHRRPSIKRRRSPAVTRDGPPQGLQFVQTRPGNARIFTYAKSQCEK